LSKEDTVSISLKILALVFKFKKQNSNVTSKNLGLKSMGHEMSQKGKVVGTSSCCNGLLKRLVQITTESAIFNAL
jgi:hypothetical protein